MAREPRRRDEKLTGFVAALVSSGAASGAVAAVGDRRRLVASAGAGQCALATRFDLASLTKPFVATLALVLDREGALDLTGRIGDFWPRVSSPLAQRRLEDLLRHRSGLPGWVPISALAASRSPRDVADLLLRRLPVRRDGGVEYSDLGYILWGLTAERALGRPLAALLEEGVLGPLALAGVEPWPGRRGDVARSRLDTAFEIELARRRGLPPPARVLPAPPVGTPQDGNARFLRRFTGHAGLFGAAGDLHRLAREWLAPGRLLRVADVERALAGGAEYALGWARRRVRGSAGRALGARAFGHTGYTGGSMWIDPAAERIYVLLAHRTRADSDFNRHRREFHRVAQQVAIPARAQTSSSRSQ